MKFEAIVAQGISQISNEKHFQKGTILSCNINKARSLPSSLPAFLPSFLPNESSLVSLEALVCSIPMYYILGCLEILLIPSFY